MEHLIELWAERYDTVASSFVMFGLIAWILITFTSFLVGLIRERRERWLKENRSLQDQVNPQELKRYWRIAGTAVSIVVGAPVAFIGIKYYSEVFWLWSILAAIACGLIGAFTVIRMADLMNIYRRSKFVIFTLIAYLLTIVTAHIVIMIIRVLVAITTIAPIPETYITPL